MITAIKNKWVKALRSGNYKQGIGYLCKSDDGQNYEYCCLGVLADIAIDGEWELEENDRDDIIYQENKLPYEYHIDGCDQSLDPNMLDEVGLLDEIQDRLIDLNDRDMQSFSEIADWIEKYC